MKYMGSKNKIAKFILPIILNNRQIGQTYVEPFVGGFNMIDKVAGPRIANDSNHYVIALFKAVIAGWIPPKITRDKYYEIKNNKQNYEDHVVGWAGIGCSYCGVWFGSYSGETKTKEGLRDYQSESIRNIVKQTKGMNDIKIFSMCYSNLIIPERSIIYCDIPYRGTSGYRDVFNHEYFYDWCIRKKEEGHTVFISEYSMPECFSVMWESTVKSSLSANGKSGKSKLSVERLYTL